MIINESVCRPAHIPNIQTPTLTNHCALVQQFDEQGLHNWINFRREDKAPCKWQEHLDEPRVINAHDSNNWSDLQTVQDNLAQFDKYSQYGIGFVLTRGEGLTVIDIDYPKEPNPE